MINLNQNNLPSAPSASPDIQAHLSHLIRPSLRHAIALAALNAIATHSCVNHQTPIPHVASSEVVPIPNASPIITMASELNPIPVALPEAGSLVPTEKINQAIHDSFIQIVIEDLDADAPQTHFCSGWIAGPSTFVTASHCFDYSQNPQRKIVLKHFKTDQLNDLEFTTLQEGITPDTMNFATATDKDLAVIVTNVSVSPAPAVLSVATSFEDQNFYVGHFKGYDKTEAWQIDSGKLSNEQYNSTKYLGETFDFTVQCGNSGGAIFDDHGHVAGIVTHLLETNQHGLGPSFTKEEIEELAQRANSGMIKDAGK